MKNLQLVNFFSERKTIPHLWISVFYPILKARGFIPLLSNYTFNEDKRGVCLYRYTGGIGDILSIVPSINVLSETVKVTVVFQERFKPFFKYAKNVDFISVESSSYFKLRTSYKHFYDLYCPAGDHEVATEFKPIEARAVSFAKFLGVKLREKDFYLEWRSLVVSKKAVIQVYSDNISKDVDSFLLLEIARFLEALNYKVIFISKEKFGFSESKYFDHLDDLLDEVISSEIIISSDSAIFHIAGIFNKPVLGLFGPTNGRVTSSIYPSADYLQSTYSGGCYLPCYYSSLNSYKCGLKVGGCMSHFSLDEIKHKIIELIP